MFRLILLLLSSHFFSQISLARELERADIYDIKGPVIYSSKFLFYSIPILCFLLLTGFFIFLIRKIMKKERVPPILPAHEIAYEALKELKGKKFPEDSVNRYYFELSDIIRRYLKNRYGYRTLEMTTEELLVRVKESKKLSQEQEDLLKAFLMQCDQGKFAYYRPSPEEMEWSFNTGHEIINKTKTETL